MKYLTRKEELVLLAIFRLEESASLVNIREHLNKFTNRKWSVGNVYVPLDRMTKRCYLDSSVGEPTAKRGGKAVKYYKLSHKGMRALAELKKVHDVMWTGLPEIVLEK